MKNNLVGKAVLAAGKGSVDSATIEAATKRYVQLLEHGDGANGSDVDELAKLLTLLELSPDVVSHDRAAIAELRKCEGCVNAAKDVGDKIDKAEQDLRDFDAATQAVLNQRAAARNSLEEELDRVNRVYQQAQGAVNRIAAMNLPPRILSCNCPPKMQDLKKLAKRA